MPILQGGNRHIDRYVVAGARAQGEFGRASGLLALGKQAAERRPVTAADEARDRFADQGFAPRRDQGRKALVAVQHGAVVGQRDRALLHLFDEHAIRAIGVFQRVDLLAARTAHHHGVDFTVADRLEGFLRLAQPCAQFGQPGVVVKRDLGRWLHGSLWSAFGKDARSSPASTRS